MVKAASFAITLSPSGKLPSVSIDFKSGLGGGFDATTLKAITILILEFHTWEGCSFRR